MLAVVGAGTAAVLALTLYLGTLDNPFVFDDFNEVVYNPSLREPSNLKALLLRFPTRPLTNLLYLSAFTVTGVNPLAYHAISIVLHTLNVVLLFILVASLDRRVRIAGDGDLGSVIAPFTAAALFAVHPLMTESVGYTSSQSELLYSVFFLASLLLFARALTADGGVWPVAGGVCFALGLVSKETTAILPAVLLLYDWIVLPGTGADRRRRLRRVHGPLFGIVALLGVARIWLYLTVEHPAGAGWQWQSAGLELWVSFRYAALLLWPMGQTIVQPVAALESLADPRVLSALALAVLTMVIAVMARRRIPLVTFGLAWFFLLLIPSAALIVVANIGQPMAEHRAYLASAGLLICASALALEGWRILPATTRTPLVLGCLALVVALLGTRTVARNRVWDEPVRLWQEAAQRSPGAWMAHYGLGDAYRRSGQVEQAVAAWERVLVLTPGNPTVYPPLVDALVELHRPERARTVLAFGYQHLPLNEPVRAMLADLSARTSTASHVGVSSR
jgi:hypothetical protein